MTAIEASMPEVVRTSENSRRRASLRTSLSSGHPQPFGYTPMNHRPDQATGHMYKRHRTSLTRVGVLLLQPEPALVSAAGLALRPLRPDMTVRPGKITTLTLVSAGDDDILTLAHVNELHDGLARAVFHSSPTMDRGDRPHTALGIMGAESDFNVHDGSLPRSHCISSRALTANAAQSPMGIPDGADGGAYV